MLAEIRKHSALTPGRGGGHVVGFKFVDNDDHETRDIFLLTGVVGRLVGWYAPRVKI